jgi:hypothetical protein
MENTVTIEALPHLQKWDANLESKLGLFHIDMSQSRRWLKACLKDHQNCRPPNPDFVPHRLLFVGDSQTNPILIPQFGEKVSSYAALSYCWGTAEVLVTKTSNIMDHFKSIDLKCLPKVCCCTLQRRKC